MPLILHDPSNYYPNERDLPLPQTVLPVSSLRSRDVQAQETHRPRLLCHLHQHADDRPIVARQRGWYLHMACLQTLCTGTHK